MTDWIEHNGGPQPVADDVWVAVRAHHVPFDILNQHLIDAARLEGIRLGLEAAKRHAEACVAVQSGRLVAIPSLDPATIAREAVLDQLTREAQTDNMGYDND